MLDNLTLKKIYDSLIAEATKDGVFRLDESILIKNIIANLETYTKIIDEALEDGVVSGTERLQLFHSRMALMQDAIKTASVDDTISKAEFNLLKKIQKILDEIDSKVIKPKT